MAEPLGAAFFTLKRRDRIVLLPATIVFLVLISLVIGAFVALNWQLLSGFATTFTQSAQGELMSEEQSLQFVGQFFGLFGSIFLFLFPIYILIAAYEAACLRWMIRGEAPGLFGITINKDVWRVWGVYWCWLLVQIVIAMAMSMLMIPVMFMTMGSMMSNPSPENMMHWQLTVQLPLTLLQYAPLIFLGIRFGPAAATSVLRNRFSFFEAWEVTRGRFWQLFGAFAVWTLPFVLLFGVSYAASFLLQYQGDWQHIFQTWPQPNSEEASAIFARTFSVAGMSIMAIGLAVNALLWLIWAVMSYGINARAALAAQEDGKISFIADET
ncbi:hypothetical protein [Candidatus Viadribacter manganicus]|uniref:DUF4013 domain-containing protein n=1 Tax=Candidatus Viadribacter manganicus TaxID=1759059 RepID=A0A1B1ADN7_9PROT|nr:hypothetical protein [Candidatus Viadribacter manganicus]ANP44668.1 hypothetical protein ATE48_01395 [Candidatus Viadribacter manganicus]